MGKIIIQKFPFHDSILINELICMNLFEFGLKLKLITYYLQFHVNRNAC